MNCVSTGGEAQRCETDTSPLFVHSPSLLHLSSTLPPSLPSFLLSLPPSLNFPLPLPRSLPPFPFLTIATAVDGCPVLPPPDALPSDTPLSGGHTAVAAQLGGREGGGGGGGEGRERGREGGRERGTEGGREGGREGVGEGGRESEQVSTEVYGQLVSD